jgi:DNA-binding IclR family transcriptional regulator
MKNREKYHVRSTQRALRILGCFSVEKPDLNITEISKMLGLYKSTVYSLLVTMEDEGFVIKNPDTNTYSPSYKILQLGYIAKNKFDLEAIAQLAMLRLRDETDEGVALSVISQNKRLVLTVVDSNNPFRLFLVKGQVAPLHCSAAGKILLTGLDEDELSKIIDTAPLEAVTQNTITDPALLRVELNKIKEQGYALCNGEGYIDAGSVAAPIYDISNKLIASLSIHGQLTKYESNRLPKFIELVKKEAFELSRILGYRT